MYEGKSIRVIEECKEFESLYSRTHDSELWLRIEGKERMIKNYVYKSREMEYLQGSMIVVLWLAYNYLGFPELAYDSQMVLKIVYG